MSEDSIDREINRREFLMAAATTVVAATATGAGTAVLLDRGKKPTTIVPPPTIPEAIPTAANAGQDISGLLSQLAESQADNLLLRTQLDSYQRQLEAAQSATPEPDRSMVANMQSQLDDANTQVETLSGQIGTLGGLLALYQQLDEVDMAAVVEGGISVVGQAMGDLMEKVPTVEEGIQIGQEALDELEEHIPLVSEGRNWLTGRIGKFRNSYLAIELALENALEASGAFLQMLNEWAQKILSWLPFGIGDNAGAVLDTVTELIADIPDAIEGLQNNVARPLDVWLLEEEGQTQLHKRLIKPVREKTLASAGEAAGKARTLQAAYQGQLADPTLAAAERQRVIKETITEYRQTHQI